MIYYCPVALTKKSVHLICCIFIGMEVLEDWPISSCIARRQERGSTACKHRQMGEAKTKVYIFIDIDKTLTSRFFRSYITIAN